VKVSALHTNERRLFQTVGTQHENRRAAVFVNEDCVDSRSDVDDRRTRDCLYDESRHVVLTYDVVDSLPGQAAAPTWT